MLRRVVCPMRWTKVVTVVVLTALSPLAANAQGSGPGLVVPVPPLAQVSIVSDSFRVADGTWRGFEMQRAVGAHGALPVVIFANGAGPGLRQMRSYRDWARLVTTRGMAGVLYDGATFGTQEALPDYLRRSVGYLDSLTATLDRRSDALGIDASNIIIWAGSAQTMTGTAFALGGHRRVSGYVLYYGSGEVREPTTTVPVFIARAGLDSPGLNAALDSLTRQLMRAGVPVTVVNYPAGSHGFDLVDSTAMSARVIEQTLDFMSAAVERPLQQAISDGAPEAAAAGAMAARQWGEAERLYAALQQRRPESRSIAWRLGLAQLANDHPSAALVSFDRARALGQGGARDIGLPAVRAAVRAGNTARAVEWLRWALQSFPRIRAEVQGDAELAPLLERPELTGDS